GGGCGDDDDHHELPAKDKVFTKARGPNTNGLAGEDVEGTCPTDEKGKAACYGNTLVHCSDDGEAHAVDCTTRTTGTMKKCVETDPAADCQYPTAGSHEDHLCPPGCVGGFGVCRSDGAPRVAPPRCGGHPRRRVRHGDGRSRVSGAAPAPLHQA